jgi:hypothetical protein
MLLFGEWFGVSVPVKMLQSVAICYSGPLSTIHVANSYKLLQFVAKPQNPERSTRQSADRQHWQYFFAEPCPKIPLPNPYY